MPDNRTAPDRVLSRIGQVALAVAAIAGVCSALLFGAVRAGQLATVEIVSGSMHPTVSVGDLLISRPTPADQLQVGDVATVSSERTGGLVTHRVVDIAPGAQNDSRALTMKGDANTDVDIETYDVTKALVHKATIPAGGHITTTLTTAPGSYFALLGFIAVLGLTFIPRETSRQSETTPQEARQ